MLLARALWLLAILILPATALEHGWARDLGQWGNVDPIERAWYQNAKQPDRREASCCGEADAYWADAYEVNAGGDVVAIITDDRPDAPLLRQHIPIGTKIVVPKNKIMQADQPRNPTGHGILFMGAWTHVVYCYSPPGGV